MILTFPSTNWLEHRQEIRHSLDISPQTRWRRWGGQWINNVLSGVSLNNNLIAFYFQIHHRVREYQSSPLASSLVATPLIQIVNTDILFSGDSWSCLWFHLVFNFELLNRFNCFWLILYSQNSSKSYDNNTEVFNQSNSLRMISWYNNSKEIVIKRVLMDICVGVTDKLLIKINVTT